MSQAERDHWLSTLSDCNYCMAAGVFEQQWSEAALKKELVVLLDAFLDHPCFETALGLIDWRADLALMFVACKRDGAITRANL